MAGAELVPSRAARIGMLGACALAAAPQLARLPAWLAAAGGALLLWSLAVELGRVARPGRGVRLLLTLAAVGAVLAEFHTVVGREAGAALLASLLCLKALEAQHRRDWALLVALSYFLVATGFLFSRSVLTGAHALLALLALTAGLAQLNRGGPADAKHAGDAWRTATVLLLQAAPFAAVLFLVFPRPDTPLWGLPEDDVARTGLAGRMTPGDIGHLAQSRAVAFRVEFEGEPPTSDRLYWRGPVLDVFDGRNWRRGATHGAAALRYEPVTPALAYTVTLEPHDRYWAFALDLPAAVPAGMRLGAGLQLLTARPVHQPLRYRVASHLRYEGAGLDETGLSRYLRLPRGAAPRARALARGWRRDAGGDRAVVDTALRWLAGEPFFYTLHPPRIDGDPVDGFLFGTRRGFCGHFSSAFTVLMRAAGIPARVVTGYLGAERNPLGGHYVVRQSDAHAWTEVWLDGRGWVRIDPTSVVPPGRIDASVRSLSPADAARKAGTTDWAQAFALRLRHGWDRVDYLWHRWVADYDARRQAAVFDALRRGEGWGAIAALFALGAGTLLLARLLERHGGRREADVAARAYARLCAKLARVGLRRGAAETPRAFADRVAAARPDLDGELRRLTDLYLRLRYAAGPPAATDLRRLENTVGAFQAKRPLTYRYRSWKRSGPAGPPYRTRR